MRASCWALLNLMMVATTFVTTFAVTFATAEVEAQERARPAFEYSDVWSEPNPGVRYLRRTTDVPCVIHVLEVDLTREGVGVEVTPHEDRWQTVSSFASGKYAAALNGGFWGSLSRPLGAHVSDGVAWPETGDDLLFGYFAIDRRGRARISPPHDVVDPLPPLRHAVSGRPLLVEARELAIDQIDPVGGSNFRQPRSAVGVSRSGRKVWFVVTDGRQVTSRGITLYELGRTLIELGAHRALNLDGGGSSTMYVERLGGVINAPSGGRWRRPLGLGAETTKVRTRDGREQVFVRGVEREVMSHLGIVAPSVESPLAATRWNDDLPVVLPPRQPEISLGQWRERIVPLTLTTVAAIFLLFVWLAYRRSFSE